jgi:hypothetical protein
MGYLLSFMVSSTRGDTPSSISDTRSDTSPF